MASRSDNAPLIVIVGPTASGKSRVALELAGRFGGEIIAADSRTLYKGMDIGTAKPSEADRRAVPHHLIDVLTPDKPVTVAWYKQQATNILADVKARGNIPFLVGGTGLYIDAILYDFEFRPVHKENRERLERLSVEDLQAELIANNIPLPENARNPRHLIRQLETGQKAPKNEALRLDTLVLGLDIEGQELKDRIESRIDSMLRQGLQREVNELVALYGWDTVPLQTIGYKEFKPVMEGAASFTEARQAILRNTYQYARRQRTWFRRNKSIHWVRSSGECVDLVTTFLNK